MNFKAAGRVAAAGVALALVGPALAPGISLAQDGPAIVISAAPPSGWVGDGEYVLSATATSPLGLWAAGWGTKKGASLRCPISGSVCPSVVSDTFVFRPAKWPDGVHTLGFYAQDQQFKWSAKEFEVWIDHTPPSAPQGLTLVGGDTWRAANDFSVSWNRPREEQAAPIVGVEYRICPAANDPGNLTSCVHGQRSGTNLEWLNDLAVPGSGVWRLRVALRDAAGNVDLAGGATVTNLRLDADPPEIAFVAADPSDPARVTVAAGDAASGIHRVTIEARRDGEDVWRSLNLEPVAGGFTTLLDDADLPAGTYELRAHAVDKVGNERTVTGGLDGSVFRVRLPVREGTLIEAGLARRGRALNPHPTVPYGKALTLSGRVTDSFGGPRSGVAIEVAERLALAGAEWRPLGTVTTDANGAYSYRAKRGMARTIRFQYAGTPTTRPDAAEVALRVKAATTLTPSRRSLTNGETVVLRGRLLGGPVPAAGKVVTVQARTRRGWLTFGTARARARDGRWSYRYTFTDTSTTVRYRFRAVVLREQAYPYVRGTSPTVSVLVRGSAR